MTDRHETSADRQDRRAAALFTDAAGSCPHVSPSLCTRHGPHQEPHDPCPWVTFYTDADGRYIKLEEHHDSRAAHRAAEDRNCLWGRVIRETSNGMIVEHGDGFHN